MPRFPDTAAVAEFMAAFGQTVRTVPTTEITSEERALRVSLVVEEALEFAAAMGCVVSLGPGHSTTPEGAPIVTDDDLAVQVDPGRDIDLVEALDAVVDLVVVTKGSAHTLGFDADAAFGIVHATNMAKLGPDGQPLRRADGKVIKPEGWQGPTAGLTRLLRDAGWDPQASTAGPDQQGSQ